jgi:hypothetical protein
MDPCCRDNFHKLIFSIEGQNVQSPQLQQQGNSKIMNSAYILASLHDSPNNVNTQQQSLVVKPQGGNTIVAGQANKITISTNDNSQLKGALLYGQDGTGTRQGSFTDANNGPFVPFAGCGKNPQGDISGVIQQQGVTASNSYSSLVYNAPACVPGNNITIGGLSVTGSGFGIWTYSFTVSGSSCGGGATGGNANQGTGTTTGNTGTGTKGTGSGKAGTSAGASAQAGAGAASSVAVAGSAIPSISKAQSSAVASSAVAQAGKGKKSYGQGWKAATTFSKAVKAKTTCTAKA